jgi:hypothetical protein
MFLQNIGTPIGITQLVALQLFKGAQRSQEDTDNFLVTVYNR